ncbi:MAG: type II secretion system protein [Polyangiaceae bacterium]
MNTKSSEKRFTYLQESLRTKLARLRLAQKGGSRGVTLVEVLIVVAIIAMVAGGVAVFALPKYKEAQIKNAETGARIVRTAIQQWQAANNETSCPTMSQLVQEKQLDPGQSTKDSWNQDFSLTCTDDEVIISSNGPDKKKGTKDDIVVPKGAGTPAEGQ